MRVRLAAIVAVAALAVGVAGCGGEGPPSRAQFTAQAEDICRQAHGAADTDPRAALARYDTTLAGLRGLTPPAELAASWERALTLLDAERRLLAQVIRRRDGGTDPRTLAATFTPRAERLHARITDAFTRLGLDACVTGPGA